MSSIFIVVALITDEMSNYDINRVTRRRLMKTAGTVGITGTFAGCSGLDGSESDDEGAEQSQPAPGEQKINALWEKLKEEAEPPEGKITVAFGFLEQVPITTEVYMPSSDAGLWDTGTYDTADLSEASLLKQPPEKLPMVETDDMRGYYAFMEPGQQAQVALTVTNDQEEAQFIAAPPDLKPYGLYEGLIANCYCTGLTYTVPEGGTWTRVIRAKLREAMQPGAVGLAVWPVVPGDKGSGDDTGQFDGWFSDVSNFDGVVDETGQSEVAVTVGSEANDGSFGFEPPAVKVSTGTTVVWEWTGKGGGHNVVADDGSFRSGDPVGDEGTTFEYTFDETGTNKYYCAPHKSMGMKGAVVVE
jgi:halocyanin-like protein